MKSMHRNSLPSSRGHEPKGNTMKKIIITIAITAAAGFATPAIAQATPDMCAGHVDQKDASGGRHAGDKSVPGCEGDSGPDYANNARTPDAAPHPDARQPISPVNQGELGTFDDNQFVVDSDGLQADDVRNSPIYVPQSHS